MLKRGIRIVVGYVTASSKNLIVLDILDYSRLFFMDNSTLVIETMQGILLFSLSEHLHFNTDI